MTLCVQSKPMNIMLHLSRIMRASFHFMSAEYSVFALIGRGSNRKNVLKLNVIVTVTPFPNFYLPFIIVALCASEGIKIKLYQCKKEKNCVLLREDKNKTNKNFLVVGPLRFYPPYTNGFMVHAPLFFFSLIIFFQFLPNFWAETAGFWLWGFTLPTLLVVRTLEKTFFNMYVFP